MLEQSEEGRELLRTLMVSGVDITNEWFESEEVKIALTRFIAEGNMDPQINGCGITLLLFIGIIHKYGWGCPVGGSGALSNALAQCIEDLGGTIRTSSTVKRFKIERGEAKGVILDSGEEILAKQSVITTFSIKQIPEMVGERNLPTNFAHKCRRLHHDSFQALHQVLALNEAPKYKADLKGEETIFVQFCSQSWEDHLRVFDNYKFGIPYTKDPLALCWTIIDPSRAPAGKHTLFLHHFEPYSLKGGAARWDAIKQEVADGILQSVQDRCTNMGKENILGRWVSSPLDYEQYNPSWSNADWMHIGMFLYQILGNRPFPEWSNSRMPVKKLYLCGASTSSGGGVNCGGRMAVQIVTEDLGIDFEKVASR